MLKWCFAVALAGAVAVGTAYAAEAGKGKGKGGSPPSAEEIFKKLDTNNDGKIDLTEYGKSRRMEGKSKEEVKAAFDKIAKKDSAGITLEELKANIDKRRAEHKDGHRGGKKK